MKRYIVFITLSICLLTATATTVQKYSFDHYAKMNNITRVYISKKLFDIIGNAPLTSAGLNFSKIVHKLDGLLVLNGETYAIKEQMKKDEKKFEQSTYYDVFLRHSEKNESRVVYIHEEKKSIVEMVIFIFNEDSYSIIQVLGKLQPKDLSTIMNMQ